MVTFAETTQVTPMELCEPPCLTTTLSPGLQRKNMLWQNAVKHIIIQQELSAQVTDYPIVMTRFVASRWKCYWYCFVCYYIVHIPNNIMRTLYTTIDMVSSETMLHVTQTKKIELK